MTSGRWVVLALLGGLAAISAIVLVAFLLFEPEGAPCAEGELADNTFADGRFETRRETFASVEEAEAFICHDVPELQAPGWTLGSIAAERSVPLELLVEGEGIGLVTLGYVEDGTGRPLTLDTLPFFGPEGYFEQNIPPQASKESVSVQGNAGTAYRFGINPDFVEVVWRSETLEHRASVQLTPDFALSDLLALLETLQ